MLTYYQITVSLIVFVLFAYLRKNIFYEFIVIFISMPIFVIASFYKQGSLNDLTHYIIIVLFFVLFYIAGIYSIKVRHGVTLKEAFNYEPIITMAIFIIIFLLSKNMEEYTTPYIVFLSAPVSFAICFLLRKYWTKEK